MNLTIIINSESDNDIILEPKENQEPIKVPLKTKSISVANYFTQLVDGSELSQKEICKKLGYTKPNLVSMLKTGATKIPLYKIPLIAKIFGVSETEFMVKAMKEYDMELYNAVTQCLPLDIPVERKEFLDNIINLVGEKNFDQNPSKYLSIIAEGLK